MSRTDPRLLEELGEILARGSEVKQINLVRKLNGPRRKSWRVLRALRIIGDDPEKARQFDSLRFVYSLAIQRQRERPTARPYMILEHGPRRPIGWRSRRLSEARMRIEDALQQDTDARQKARLAGVEIPPAFIEVALDSYEARLVSEVLELLLRDEDPRDLLFESLKHRPKETGLPKALALNVVLNCRSGKLEKAAKSVLAELAGVTANQIKHALAEHREVCELVVDSFAESEIESLLAWNLRELQFRAERAKKSRYVVETHYGAFIVESGKK